MALLQSRAIVQPLSISTAACRSRSSPGTALCTVARGWNSGFPIRSDEAISPLLQQEWENRVGTSAMNMAVEGFGVPDNENEDEAPDSSPEAEPVEGLILSLGAPKRFETLSKDAAMGLVLHAATGKGWTTGSGLEGPAVPDSAHSKGDDLEDNQWPSLTRSPRRRMRVAFTCNVCGHRTTRAINPHAYTDGTVFVQCGGCNVFHKLVDNLNLFHELQGRVFGGYQEPGFAYHESYDYLTSSTITWDEKHQ